MKSFTLDAQSLLAVVAAVIDDDGVLLEANAGFLRLLPDAGAKPVGARVARFFIQPTFPQLRSAPALDPDGYRGLLTIGDFEGKTRTLRGRVWRSPAGIRVLAEYDIADLEKMSDALLEMNRESAVAQHDLARANITLKQREARSVEASLTDALTGVGNRRRLEQALETELARVRRTGGLLTAVMADIDHFKRVNDDYGHAAGDKVLARFGGLLRSQTRPTDIAARFGGEEFIVLMPHTNLAQGAAKAEQIRCAVAAEPIEPLPRVVTASFGVAELAPGETAEAFIGRADAALYRAKESGRNRVVTAD